MSNMALQTGNKCYKKFIKHIIDAAKYICEDNTSEVSKEDLNIFSAISESGNFKISYTHDHFEDDNNLTFVAEGKVIQEKANKIPMYGIEDVPDNGVCEFVFLRLVDRKGSYQVRFSVTEWKLICEYISKEIDIIRNDCIRAESQED